MNPEDIKAIFGLEPEAAVEYLKQKGVAVSWDWQDMLDDAHATAFTVAKAQSVHPDIARVALKTMMTNSKFKSSLSAVDLAWVLKLIKG